MLLAGYVGAIVLLMLLENWLIFRPAGTGPGDWLSPPDPRIKDVALTTADGTPLHGWWLPRDGASGTLLFFCGNAGNMSWRGHAICTLSEQLGVSVLIVDYPGYGKSGGKPSEAGCYACADAAYAWLLKQGLRGEDVVIFGESLGGGVAVDLASRQPHRALILVKTFTSMPDVGQDIYPWLPARWLVRNKFHSLSKIERCKQPVFIAHGDADRLIPFAHGQRLYEAAPGKKKFLRLAGADHNDPLPAELFTALKRFLDREAPARRPSGGG
jgi:fermentation-respiration switch protein FrsA (DUF1100 family)